MGRVLVVDGPEKCGKTTLCHALEDALGLRYRHWGPIKHATEYGRALRGDQASTDDWVWDRSWASEAVYSRYFGRSSQIADDHWLGEWLYGNAARTTGLEVMLCHPWQEHDESDLPIPQAQEVAAFFTYGSYFGWEVVERPWAINDLVPRIVQAWVNHPQVPEAAPPVWVGPSWSPIVIVGDQRNDPSSWDAAAEPTPYPGPFSSRYTTTLAKSLGFRAFDVAWTNSAECAPSLLRGKYVVACGAVAQGWVRTVEGVADVFDFEHPAHLYRWGMRRNEIKYREADLIKYIEQVTELGEVLRNGLR